MKRQLLLLCLILLATVAFAGEHQHAAVASSPGFEKMKSLVGEWKGEWSHPTLGKGDIKLTVKDVSGNRVQGDHSFSKDGRWTHAPVDGTIQEKDGVSYLTFERQARPSNVTNVFKIVSEAHMEGTASGTRVTTITLDKVAK